MEGFQNLLGNWGTPRCDHLTFGSKFVMLWNGVVPIRVSRRNVGTF